MITPVREIKNGTVLIQQGLIKEVGPRELLDLPETTEVIDVKGAYISPGFIDLHLHGAGGGDVMAASDHDLELMSLGVAKGGVTSFLPTTLSGSLDSIVQAVNCISRAMSRGVSGAKILGAHLEGPYFNIKQCGAQNPRFITIRNWN